ncbi:hypothetical protein [Clostridium sp. YIM B02551]|uniref:hypothetical protein n=1 Tax=Clostridium sp. YIM B02551 TaxID=2910679 RepID=UPI001EEA66F8|nr:hypothetical protein [Clostridium sp. YIM B02551]
MINNSKRPKENVLINLNVDKEILKYWAEDDGLIFESNIVTIPTSKLKEYVDINDLSNEFSNKVNNVGISNNDISIILDNGDLNKILNLKEVYNKVEDTVNYVSEVLKKFKIEDYRLICNFYPSVYLMDEYSKTEHEKLRLENKLLRMQSEAMKELYQ